MIPLLFAQAAPGVTLTPALLALLGMLVAALSALVAGGVAWGRFAGALETLRGDHAELRADVRRAAEAGAQIGAIVQTIADLKAEVGALRDFKHKHGTAFERLAERVEGLASRLGHAEDDIRRSHHPSPK